MPDTLQRTVHKVLARNERNGQERDVLRAHRAWAASRVERGGIGSSLEGPTSKKKPPKRCAKMMHFDTAPSRGSCTLSVLASNWALKKLLMILDLKNQFPYQKLPLLRKQPICPSEVPYAETGCAKHVLATLSYNQQNSLSF